MFKNVKLLEHGEFLADGISIPDDMGNRHRVMIQEWIDAGNIPEPWVGPTSLENWVKGMAYSDKTLMSRMIEDILDGMADKSGVAQITLDKLQEKKDLRATKP